VPLGARQKGFEEIMINVITVDNLGKKYILSHQGKQEAYVALRDVLAEGVRHLGRRLLGRNAAAQAGGLREEFWALKGLSFEVKQGDRIGIIGRNGAGKSTLLKLLSRITAPTTGSVRIRGRVASLLEVGTGFHPELTGRENIYLNGAVLGMSRLEIKRKFDRIVAFAEVEKFLDTPVKRYSSGMYVRLAFSVAAHLEPEILVVDEVLAVGDAQYQKKCLGRMEEVSNEGRTILFVSHNMESVKFLCDRGILLNNGRAVCSGEIESVVSGYESLLLQGLDGSLRSSGCLFRNDAPCSDRFDIIELSLCDDAGNPAHLVRTFESFNFRVRFNSPDAYESKSAAIFVSTLNRGTLLRFAMHPHSSFRMTCKKGENELMCSVEKLPLPAGTYLITFAICESQTGEWLFERDLCTFDVGVADIYGCGIPPTDRLAAAVSDYRWQTL
jgi:lipopolysaccharide transport system ATP-binding protein